MTSQSAANVMLQRVGDYCTKVFVTCGIEKKRKKITNPGIHEFMMDLSA